MNETRRVILRTIIDSLNQHAGTIDAEMADENNADAYSDMEAAADLLDSAVNHLQNAAAIVDKEIDKDKDDTGDEDEAGE